MIESPRTTLLHCLAPLSTPARLAWLESFEERAALMEYEGEMARADAERSAAELVARRAGCEWRPL